MQFHWDDDEEPRYRDWLKDVASQRQNEAEWQEYEGEEAYRARLRAGGINIILKTLKNILKLM